jgi:Lhr-like helicase
MLASANVLIASPTASGKTEAIMAPVAELLKREHWSGLSVVYVVPTRAFANDTLARLQGPLGDLGIVSALKHGDRPTLPKALPNVLITTPKSLDSLICRRRSSFQDLRVVVLDEIHLLDNGYRGDQLRLLLSRFRRLCSACDAGQIHSNIPDQMTYSVVELGSGRLIGRIAAPFDSGEASMAGGVRKRKSSSREAIQRQSGSRAI